MGAVVEVGWGVLVDGRSVSSSSEKVDGICGAIGVMVAVWIGAGVRVTEALAAAMAVGWLSTGSQAAISSASRPMSRRWMCFTFALPKTTCLS